MDDRDSEDLSIAEIYEALTHVNADVTLEVIASWTPEQKEKAVAWFVAKDLYDFGIDNEVVAMPEFLKLKV